MQSSTLPTTGSVRVNRSGVSNDKSNKSVGVGAVKKMEIKISPEYGVFIPVTLNPNSGVIYSMQSDMQAFGHESSSTTTPSSYPNFNLQLLLKDVDEVAVTTYLQFLTNNPVDIVERNVMLDCLRIYSLTEDSNFFQHLLSQLLNYWTILSPVLYDPLVAEGVKDDIWLCCPRQLLPRWYLSNTAFMKRWRDNPANKEVSLNVFENFHYEWQTTQNKHIVTTSYECPTTSLKITKINETAITSKQQTPQQTPQQYQVDQWTTLSKAGSPASYHGLVIKNYAPGVDYSVQFNGRIYGPVKFFKNGLLKRSSYFGGEGLITTKNYYYDDTADNTKTTADAVNQRLLTTNFIPEERLELVSYKKIAKSGAVTKYEEKFLNDADNNLKSVIVTNLDINGHVVDYDTTIYFGNGYAKLRQGNISFYDQQGQLVEQVITGKYRDDNRYIRYNNGKVVRDDIVDDDFVNNLRNTLHTD